MQSNMTRWPGGQTEWYDLRKVIYQAEVERFDKWFDEAPDPGDRSNVDVIMEMVDKIEALERAAKHSSRNVDAWFKFCNELNSHINALKLRKKSERIEFEKRIKELERENKGLRLLECNSKICVYDDLTAHIKELEERNKLLEEILSGVPQEPEPDPLHSLIRVTGSIEADKIEQYVERICYTCHDRKPHLHGVCMDCGCQG